jgi:hypothetical protein
VPASYARRDIQTPAMLSTNWFNQRTQAFDWRLGLFGAARSVGDIRTEYDAILSSGIFIEA